MACSRSPTPRLGIGLGAAMMLCCADTATDDEETAAAQTTTAEEMATTGTSAMSMSTSAGTSMSGSDPDASTMTSRGSSDDSATGSSDSGAAFEEFAPVLSILESSCGSGADMACHDYNDFVTVQPVLEGTEAYDNIVDVPSSIGMPYVDSTGDLQNSYLWEKLTQDPPTEGERMPRGWPALDEASLDAIRTWIEGGALP